MAIAVADDIPEIQALACLWLQAEGHSVHCAPDGRALERLARAHRLDMVITDIVMPESDGLEVIMRLKRSQPTVRIIAMSGGGSVMAANDCLKIAQRLGADAVLTKPFNRAQLLAAVNLAASARRSGTRHDSVV
ncbi:MAG TPA: response regulator [Opitutaceae bacterium]|nr:response regulator [Opitutaceae bacterium]